MSVKVDRTQCPDSKKYYINLHSGTVAFRPRPDNSLMYNLDNGCEAHFNHENWAPLSVGNRVTLTLEI